MFPIEIYLYNWLAGFCPSKGQTDGTSRYLSKHHCEEADA